MLIKITPSDPITFLISNNLGQLNLESPSQSRILADGLINLNAFDYSFHEKLVFFVGDHQLQHTDFISVIKVTCVLFHFIVQAINLTNFRTHNVYKLDHGAINALAVDWHNMMVYWADFKEEYIAIGEINLDLITITKQKILISSNLSNLKSICVDPVTRTLFWLKSGESTQIETSGLDGSQRAVIFEESGAKGRDLKIDHSTQRLVWFDETHNRVAFSNFKGGEVNYIPIRDIGNDRPQFLTASGGRIYFFNDMSIISISEKDKISLAAHVHMSFGYQPYAVKIFSSIDQIQSNHLRFTLTKL